MGNKKNLPPGPRGHFLAGSLPEIQRDRVQFLLDLQHEYQDIALIRLGPFEAVVVYHPQGIQHVLQDNHTNYSKETRTYASLSNFLGNGLIVSNGDFWLRQRRLMQPAFHRTRINALTDMICQETSLTLQQWKTVYAPGQAVDISIELMRLTLAIVTQALFGKRISDEDGRIFNSIGIMLNDTPFRFEHPFYPPLWAPTAYNRQFNAARAFLDTIIYDIIAERRAHPGLGGDLLAMLMEARTEGSGSEATAENSMSDRQLRDEVFTLLLGGHESSALALSWTLYLLSQHPEVERRLRNEVEQILGGRQPGLEDLPRLVYTRWVIDESIRFYPPAWLFERRALGDDTICGYHIPAGMNLAFTPYVTHRLPQFWEQPEVFNPERFNPDQEAKRPRYAYLPFGGGPRMCIGNIFALQEIQLVLAMLLQHYRFEADPTWEVRRDPVVSLRPKNGLRMKLFPLSGE